MSHHEVLVVAVEQVRPHGNADSLDIVKVNGYDYSIIVRKDSFKVGELGIFVEPDYVVPTDREEFKFLFDGKGSFTKRITAKRLRGVWSEGLLFKADPARHTLGQNVMEEYGITRWEPPAPKEGNGWGAEGAELQAGMTAPEPPIVGTMVPIPKYDVENFKKYSRLLEDGEQVFYTVKIHGANARYVFTGGEMHCGSRTTWKLKPGTRREFTNPRTGELIERFAPESSWWKALEDNPWIEEWCRKHPGQIVYGEIFGPKVQGNLFNYGKKENQIGFRVFDVLLNGNWVDFETLTSSPEYAELQLVPIVFSGPHNREVLEELAEAPETSLPNIPANHIREGIVIKPFKEKYDERLGRVALKYVSNNYLTKS